MSDKISEHMTSSPLSVAPQSTITDAIELMQKYKIRHIPVTQGNRVVGLLSDREIQRYKDFSDSSRTLVVDIMNQSPYHVTKGALLKDVVLDMARKKMGSAVITDKQGKVLGIFTTVDALNLLAKLLDEDDDYQTAIQTRLIDEYLDGDFETAQKA